MEFRKNSKSVQDSSDPIHPVWKFEKRVYRVLSTLAEFECDTTR